MTKDEALQMCLEYIETDAHERKYVRHAIKEALAQSEQEPVAWMVTYGGLTHIAYTQPNMVVDTHYQPLYAAGFYRKKEWVGLTDDEKQAAYIIVDGWSNCVNFIESTLREKNK